MRNVIVTGGTGFLGRNMIRRLCAEGYTVYAIVRPESKHINMLPVNAKVIPLVCDLQNISKEEALWHKSFEGFYHFAWGGVNREEIDQEEIQFSSLEESIKALQSAVELKCGNFIFSGSRSEYGNQKGPFRENAVCRPQTAYGCAKLEFGKQAFELCSHTETRYIHGRIFSVYGVDDHPWSLIYTAVNSMMHNADMDLSTCTQLWNFMDVRDMTDLFLTLCRNSDLIPADDNHVFNVATSDIRPLKEYVKDILHITNSRSELHFGAYKQSAESAISIVPDMSKVYRVFKWKPKFSFSEGINYMVQELEAYNA